MRGGDRRSTSVVGHGATEVWLRGVDTQPDARRLAALRRRRSSTPSSDFRALGRASPDRRSSPMPPTTGRASRWAAPLANVSPSLRPAGAAERARAAPARVGVRPQRAVVDGDERRVPQELPGRRRRSGRVARLRHPLRCRRSARGARVDLAIAVAPTRLRRRRRSASTAAIRRSSRPAWRCSSGPACSELYKVTQVSERSRAEFAISGKSTVLTLSGDDLSPLQRRGARRSPSMRRASGWQRGQAPKTVAGRHGDRSTSSATRRRCRRAGG